MTNKQINHTAQLKSLDNFIQNKLLIEKEYNSYFIQNAVRYFEDSDNLVVSLWFSKTINF